ncbi:sugar nucleotide-binding protein [Patescibacteria group bacterium]|nr:sugar nucleotide-binding protein [Patescibacteria group bacterium]
MKSLILVTGSTGFVGSRFVELYPRKNNLHFPRRFEFDITSFPQVRDLISNYNFRAVVNFASYTDVGAAEDQRDDKKGSCWQINVEGTRNLVRSINPNKVHFIQISTDYVFPGSKEDPGPYSEFHLPGKDSPKLTWYGYTKAEAERVIKNSLGEQATILRLIYPVRASFKDKLDYLRKPLQLYDEGKLYPMFTDQQISLTYIDEACSALNKITVEGTKGVLHASSRDVTTPYEIVSYLIERARGKKNAVKTATLDEFLQKVDNPVRYPKFGGLKVEETEKKIGMTFSTWREIVDKLVSQGIGK